MSLRPFVSSLFLFLMTGLPTPVHSQTVPVKASQIEALQIRLEKVRPAVTEAIALLPATLIRPTNSRIAVSAPFSGTVLQVNVLVGQQVQEGMALVTIASRDLLEAMGRLKQSEVELRNAEVNARRHRMLADKQAGSEMKAQEMEAEAAKLLVATEHYRRIVSLGNIRTNQDGTYTLTAPKAGRAVEIRSTAGGSLETMAAALIIDSSEELWLQAQLPASLVGHIAPGDQVAVTAEMAGTVISVGSSLDPVTRSTTLLARLPKGSDLVPGQMVTLTVSRRSGKGALAVHAHCITYLNGQAVVFKRSGEGFTVIPVSILGKTPELATIEGNLTAGEEIAMTGIAELEKMLAGE